MPQFFGDFELRDELGRGGMGVVYRARQRSLDREVAVKVLPPEMSRHGQVAERFQSEARRMAKLTHPGIAQVYVVGESDGTHYFAMQLLPGGTLEDRLLSGPLGIDDAVEIAVQVADALDHAHAQGLTHRDIKPANILFDGQGRAVVTDFGIAKAADEVRLTATGMAVGTPQYMAPEQARGNPTDSRADIYALGCVLYEMVCGRPPFTGTTAVSIAMKHMSEEPLPPRTFRGDVPDWLQSVILKCLAKEPADRFTTAGEMARSLSSQVAVQPTFRTPQPTSSGTVVIEAQPTSRKTNWLPALIGLLVVLGLGLIGAVALSERQAPLPPPPVGPTPLPELSEVPGVLGLTVADAMAKISTAKLVAEIKEERHSDDFDEGTIISQHPGAGARVEKGSIVYIVKSLGPDWGEEPEPYEPTFALDATHSNFEDQWTISHPSDWAPEASSSIDNGFEYRRTTFNAPAGDALFLVEHGPADASPMASAEDLSRRYAKAYGDRYSLIGITETTLDGWPAARWEFVVRKNTEAVTWRKTDVFVNAAGRGYAVLCQAHVDTWSTYEQFFEEVIASFRAEAQ